MFNRVKAVLRHVKRTVKSSSEKIARLRQIKFAKTQRGSLTNFKTAEHETYVALGRRFVEKFRPIEMKGKKHRFIVSFFADDHLVPGYESRRNLGIMVRLSAEEAEKKGRGRYPRDLVLGIAAIGFEEDALVIEAIQGKEKTEKTLKNEFWRTAKTPLLEFLLKTAEEHARSLGFSRVKIRRPETMYYYEKPFTSADHHIVRKGMRKLYSQLATKFGYKKGKFFYEKNL